MFRVEFALKFTPTKRFHHAEIAFSCSAVRPWKRKQRSVHPSCIAWVPSNTHAARGTRLAYYA